MAWPLIESGVRMSFFEILDDLLGRGVEEIYVF